MENLDKHFIAPTTWDPYVADQKIKVKDNPGKSGFTTGNVKKAGTRLLVQVRFSSNEKVYKPYETMELEQDSDDIIEILKSGRFGSEADLRRLLTFEKVQGRLTNVFYSMESSNTDFYPHQFKPVIRFLESPVGRLLIADEVGLGKTIEAYYIWKELQTRIDARRLLIVCPSMLREKWRSDIKLRFNQPATIINSSKDFLDLLRSHKDLGSSHTFTCIVSLESIRCSKDWRDENNRDPRSKIARLLDSYGETDDPSLFDLVVIDEAHYLRNHETASNRTARLLADAARHFVLLTATPVQLNNNNLYQLLRLISPEDFFNETIFENMIRENTPVVRALRLLWQPKPDVTGAKQEVEKALQSSYFISNQVLKQVSVELEKPEIGDEQRVKLGHMLDSCSLLGQYMTRTRKRDVLVDRVERFAVTLKVNFTEIEMHQGPRTLLKDFAAPHRSETARRMTNLLQPCRMVEFPQAKGSVFLQEGLIHRTSTGIAVRSKSELLIYEELCRAGWQPEYEKPLVLKGSTRYPDFTIEDEISGRNIYWEHLGMLERADYRLSWEAKLAWYRTNGILPAEEGIGTRGTLVTTTESSTTGFDFSTVQKKIREYLNG